MRVPRVFIAGAAAGLFAGLIGAGLLSGSDDPAAAAGPGGRGGAGGGGREAMLPAITTAAVGAATVGRTLDAIGSGRAAKSVTLVSEATGLVESLPVKAGQRVKEGDVILKLDNSEQRFAAARARAQYPVAKANYDRYAELAEADAASRLETDTAFNAYKAAEADLKAAEFQLSQQTIVAPFDGVVGLTSIEAGDYVTQGDVVTTIDDLSALIVEFAVPQEAASDINIGQKVEAFLVGQAGERIAGAVTAIDSRVDPASRTLKIEATFTNAEGKLLPGATYAVTTTNEGAPALLIPGLAVQWDRTGAYVWKLGEDGAAVRASIIVLQRRDEVAIVEGDLAAKDAVIVEGADRVRPGMAFPVAGSRAEGRASAGAGGAE